MATPARVTESLHHEGSAECHEPSNQQDQGLALVLAPMFPEARSLLEKYE